MATHEPNRSRQHVYADGSTTPPKAEKPLTDEDWDALLDDPMIDGFMRGLDPKRIVEELRRQRSKLLTHDLESLRVFQATRRLAIVMAYPGVIFLENEPGGKARMDFYNGRAARVDTDEMDAISAIEDRLERGETITIYQVNAYRNSPWWDYWVKVRPWIDYEQIVLPRQTELTGVLFKLKRDSNWNATGHA